MPHISTFLILYRQILFRLTFVAHAQLDFYSFLNFNTIMFASITHVFDKAWIYHNSTIVYYNHQALS